MSRYAATHTDWDANQVFPLVVTKHKADEIYIDPMWGISVVRVTADGSPLNAVPHTARMDDVNFARIPIGASPFVYLVRRTAMVFADSFTGAADYKLKKYWLPNTAKVLQIEYRLRETPESLGPVLTLESKMV